MYSLYTFRAAAKTAPDSLPRGLRGLLAVPLTLLLAPAMAQKATPVSSFDSIRRLNQVEVIGQAAVAQSALTDKTMLSAELSANPASVSLMGRDYISKQAIASYGDLLRPLVGVNVSNFQQGGVGYGIQMRGYTVTEHARDIVFTIDGVVQNQGSSIQTNGYVDLNPLIPETIQRLEVVRGPFSPFYGDHTLGGVISFETANKLPSSISVSGGSFGLVRALATVGFGKNDRTGYVSLEGARTDAYRANNQEKHLNGLVKYAFPLWGGTASIRAQVYGSDFGSAGYLNRADVDAGKVSRTSFIGASDGGTTNQQNLVFNYRGANASNFGSATAYIQHHDFVRIRTGVVGGAQRREDDNRVWFGADLRRTRITTVGNLPILYAVGVSFRGDRIENSRFVTKERQIVSQNQDRNVNTYTPSAYVQLQLRPTERLKITLSGRYDQLFYELRTGPTDTEVANLTAKPSTGVFSPKAGIAYLVSRGVNLFFNAARGFKAPSGYEENLFDPKLKVSKLTSYEVGLGGDNATGRLHGLIAAYLSDQTGEIQTDPQGVLTNFGDTRRSGIEVEGRAILTDQLTVFGNYTRVVAKIRNGGPDEIYVTSTPDYLALLGLDYNISGGTAANNRFLISVYDQLVGNKNLNSSGTIRSDAFHRVSGKLSYGRRSWANFSVFAQGSFYLGDGALNEMNFLSGGRILTSPQANATVSAGVKVPF